MTNAQEIKRLKDKVRALNKRLDEKDELMNIMKLIDDIEKRINDAIPTIIWPRPYQPVPYTPYWLKSITPNDFVSVYTTTSNTN